MPAFPALVSMFSNDSIHFVHNVSHLVSTVETLLFSPHDSRSSRYHRVKAVAAHTYGHRVPHLMTLTMFLTRYLHYSSTTSTSTGWIVLSDIGEVVSHIDPYHDTIPIGAVAIPSLPSSSSSLSSLSTETVTTIQVGATGEVEV